MYRISNSDRDDIIAMLSFFSEERTGRKEPSSVSNMRRRAALLARRLGRKEEIKTKQTGFPEA